MVIVTVSSTFKEVGTVGFRLFATQISLELATNKDILSKRLNDKSRGEKEVESLEVTNDFL